MTVPDGFEVRVFASEPDVRQPVAACFDERGRLWVIEYLQYPGPAGLKPVTVDQYLRTEYDRVPEPPPRGPKGADRIKVLEDTDGDGKADRVTIFLDGLNLASAIAVGRGGVFVGQAPYLLFYPDRDRDDRPDGDPEVLLSGFGMQDAHATLNSLTWGPDGWLYGAQGSTVTARIRGVEFQQGIWRYHPGTRAFELFAEGGGNTWGVDFDATGNLFGSSNGGFVAFHMVQGGYYWKGFAKHGPLHNPHTFGYFDAIAYHGPKRGGHVTPGGIIYKGDAFPESFRGAFIGGNLLSNAVYWHNLGRVGSTFDARHGGTLLDAHDTWFRPVDLLAGPDGAVYVVDWYDRRASHLDPRDTWDRSNGRIYRVAPTGTKPAPRFDLAKLSSAELVAFRDRRNDWYAAEGRRLLADRRDPSVAPALIESLRAERDEVRALRDLWALYVSVGLDRRLADDLLGHPVAGVRRWTIRLLGDDRVMDDALRLHLGDLAANDPDSMVRSQLASSCRRWRAGDALLILDNLMARAEDVDDPQVPLLIWWALEQHARGDRAAVVDLFASSLRQKRPLVERHLLERLARLLALGGTEADFRACARLLDAAPGPAQVERLMSGIEKGLEGRRLDAVPQPLQGPLRALWRRSDPSSTLIRFAARLGSAEASRAALARIADAGAPEGDRVALVGLVGQLGKSEAVDALLALIRPEERPAVRQAALAALGSFATPGVADAILERYPTLDPTSRDRVRDLLSRRKEWAFRLLDAVASGTIAVRDLPTQQVLQMAQFHDPKLDARIEAVWGRIPRSNSPEKVERIAHVRGILPEGDKGDAARGRKVFRDTCATCHRLFGEGGALGPDLSGAERGSLDFLLTSVIDPGAVIRKEYEAQTIATTDGRVLTGLVVEENDRAITLLDNKQQKIVLPRSEVDERRPSPVSFMPEGLLDPLRDDQVRDLFRYLQGPGPR
jgi:putative membrane-bound dehydrogenase-like protein